MLDKGIRLSDLSVGELFSLIAHVHENDAGGIVYIAVQNEIVRRLVYGTESADLQAGLPLRQR